MDITIDAERRQLAAAPSRAGRTLLVYLGLVAAPVTFAILALHWGGRLGGPGTSGTAPAVPAPPDPYPRLLLALPAILIVCQLAGRAARRLGQPPVIGEIGAGIMLGPSLLGWAWPHAFHWLFPDYLTPTINTLAQLGLVFFMFLVGYELDLGAVARRSATTALISHVSIAVPFLSGIVLALAMYRPLSSTAVAFPAFALFLAVAMSVTAFPVLARILTDRGMAASPLGALALTCAAVDDVTAWCLLALAVALAHHTALSAAAVTAALAVGFVALMIMAVRPLLTRLFGAGATGRRVLPDGAVLPMLVSGVLLSALATTVIGIHPIFGAFLFGAVLPRDPLPVRRSAEQLHRVTTAVLLPLFFVSTGLQTKFGLLGGDVRLWGWCAVITVVAVAGKWGGSALAARATGTDWRTSLALGALMNCRGLTELVVLGIGLQLGVISPTVFAMLVIMTLVSTVLTAPGLRLTVARPQFRQEDDVPLRRTAEPRPVDQR